MVSAVLAAKPAVIVHKMTDLKGHPTCANSTARLRPATACARKDEAARGAGARRSIAQSFCGWPYARVGDPVKSAGDPLDRNPARELRRTLDAIRCLETAVTGATHMERIRCATTPSRAAIPACSTDLSSSRSAAVSRRSLAMATTEGCSSTSRTGAETIAVAVERGKAGEIYNVDDDPVPLRDWLPAIALHARRQAAAQRARLARPPARGRARRDHDDAGTPVRAPKPSRN
jgi:2-alkyl-3-oxoalkanoate reductase